MLSICQIIQIQTYTSVVFACFIYVKTGFFEANADMLYQDEVHGSIREQIDKNVEVVYVEAPDKPSGKRKQKVHIEYGLVGYIPVDELIKTEQA